MERFLRPERFNTEPNTPDASKHWNHWLCTFNNFLSSLPDQTVDNKLNLLINFIDPAVYEHIADCTSYTSAIDLLNSIYIKPRNEVFARHVLATTKQESGQSLDQFLQKLKKLAKDCNFTAVTANKNRDDFIRDAFICGLSSHQIRQRLLENKSIELMAAYEQARSLEMAQQHSQNYTTPVTIPCSSTTSQPSENECDSYTAAASTAKCYFCGYQRHPRSKCPALEALCKNCGKKGHFQKVCRSKGKQTNFASAADPSLNSVFSAAAPINLQRAVIDVTLFDKPLKALIDTGSTESFISTEVVLSLQLKVYKSRKAISMASTNLSSTTKGHCFATLVYKEQIYDNVKLSILEGLCSDLILGHDFLEQHDGLQISFKGAKPTFSICSLAAAKIEPVSLFKNLLPEIRPVATKSRRFSFPDKDFIDSEIQKLLAEDIIEPSESPWRAQVLVTTNDRHKKRMVVDYSQTINRFTLLDAYPLPRIDEMIENISRFEVYSTLDLRSAYHQIPIKEDERPYTAFEAIGNLYQFKRIPFGVTNGVACFQRIIDTMIRKEKLNDTFAYLDNVTICGRNQQEHDENLAHFMQCAKEYNITFNESKTIESVKQIKLLGFLVSKGCIQPDPDRLQPLRDLTYPHNLKSQQRIIGMFAYYSSWISRFSDKIHPLIKNTTFPLSEEAKQSFELLKKEIENATVITIDHDLPLVVETDASDIAIAATLNQNGRPVAFFSRTLNNSEKKHSSVEKEAYAIVEALRKWKHYLLGKHFKLVTDQKSVAFMYGNSPKGKVKNDKIQRWKIELSCYSYDVVYRPGKENNAADAFSRVYCSSTSANTESLQTIHDSLGHPGIARMNHFVKSKNLPYSVDEIRKICINCKVCCELKPSFYKPSNSHLIKATQPFERLSVDFKGPLPSVSRNKYLLTIVDEYSRFPFAFSCPDMTSSTVIKCFCQLFSLFGMPSSIHSDRGPGFMSNELQDFLLKKGIASSRTTPYNPRGNGQVERLNGTLWRTINLSLKSRGLQINQWESVLLDSLHSIRSLLCTATNETPHERIFRYNRKSTTGTTLPTWLTTPGTVLMKRNVRASKYEPLVEEVELLNANPLFAYVRLPDGRETTVALRHLAPPGDIAIQDPSVQQSESIDIVTTPLTQNDTEIHVEPQAETEPVSRSTPQPPQPLVRTTEVEESQNSLSDEASVVDPEGPLRSESAQNSSNRKTKTNTFIRTRPYNLRNREA